MVRKNLGKIKGFSIQFLPYSEIRGLTSAQRIKKILGIVLGNNILMIQGRLEAEEEARLIGDTRKFRELTGWEPEISFEQMLKDILEYWRDFVREGLY